MRSDGAAGVLARRMSHRARDSPGAA